MKELRAVNEIFCMFFKMNVEKYMRGSRNSRSYCFQAKACICLSFLQVHNNGLTSLGTDIYDQLHKKA